jgi:uncharacterized protein (TIGR00369 family)
MSNAFSEARRIARESKNYEPLMALMPYSRFIGVQLLEVDGKPRVMLPYRPSLIGNAQMPALHGGVTAAFMENAALMQLLLQLDETRVPKSIDFSIDYLKPGRPEDTYADCKISRAGQRVAHVSINCWQRSPDQVIALARGHFLLTSTE